MVEKTERRIIIPESEINNIDLELLSYAEHYFIGSQVSMYGASDSPLIPVSIIKGERTLAAVYHGREEQHWVTSNVADADLLGLVNAQRYSVIFKMADFDVATGEITSPPTLHGVYDNQQRIMIKDESQLAELGIDQERARNFVEGRMGHFFPDGNFTVQLDHS